MSLPSSPESRRLSSPTAGATTSIPAPTEIGLDVLLPDDLVFDIFSRLPVKSVCRFRCLSRGWHAVISSPAFVAAHGTRPAETFFVVFDALGSGRYDLRVIDMDGSVVTVIKDTSSLGLRSTSTSDLICVTKHSYDCAQVINPATGKVLLDWPKEPVDEYSKRGKNCHIFGFGRAVPSSEYKMVRLSDLPDCKVLTLGDNNIRWRSAQLPPTQLSIHRHSPVVVNGIMYVWASLEDYVDFSGYLLCFDLEIEEWTKTIAGPEKLVAPEVWEQTIQLRITEVNDTLCMVQSERWRTNIWLLKDSNEDIWIKKYTFSSGYYSPMPLKMTRDSDRLIFRSARFGEQGQVVQVYDPHNNTCADVPILGSVDAINIGLCSLPLKRFVCAKI